MTNMFKTAFSFTNCSSSYENKLSCPEKNELTDDFYKKRIDDLEAEVKSLRKVNIFMVLEIVKYNAHCN